MNIINTSVLISHKLTVTSCSIEIPKRYCPNNYGNIRNSSANTQVACQALCQAMDRSNCIGIVYSHTTPRRVCYLCKDNVNVTSGDGMGFYRRPGTFCMVLHKHFNFSWI